MDVQVQEDLKTKYREHMESYAEKMASMSFVVKAHPDYVAILRMGKSVSPFIIDDLKNWEFFDFKKFNAWTAFCLLHDLAGKEAPVVPKETQGKLEKVREVYLKWWDQKQQKEKV